MKYRNKYYLRVPRKLFNAEDGKTPIMKTLTLPAICLLLWLFEDEHKYTSGQENAFDEGWFYHTNQQLSEETGLCLASIKKGKSELVRKGVIEIRQTHLLAKRGRRFTGGMEERHITAFKLRL